MMHISTNKKRLSANGTALLLTLLFSVFALQAPSALSAPPQKKLSVSKVVLGFNTLKIGHDIQLDDLKRRASELTRQLPPKVSFDQLNDIADSLTDYMRDKGYKFHYAYIPPQTPKQGTVKVNIVAVSLSDVDILKNKTSIDSDYIKNQFTDLIGQPLNQNQVDKIINLLKLASGERFFAYYSRGSKSNAMRLNIKPSKNQVYTSGFSVDNYGSRTTGENRLSFFSSWGSFNNKVDKLNLALTLTDAEKSNYSGYINYQTPMWNISNHIRFSLSNNIYGIGEEFAELDIAGDAIIQDISFIHYKINNKRLSQRFSLAFSQKENEVGSVLDEAIPGTRDETVSSATLTYNVKFKASANTSHTLTTAYTTGSYNIQDVTQDESFSKLNLTYQLWYTHRPQSTKYTTGVSLQAKTQFTDKRLSIFERLPLTGVYGARSIKGGLSSADSGFILKAQAYFPELLPKDFNTTPSIFIDYANGEKFDINGQQISSDNLSSLGTAVNWKINDHIQADVIFATTLSTNADTNNIDTNQFYFQLMSRW